MSIEVGQVLSLVIRFNNSGDISATKHPYLVVEVNEDTIEVAQLDSLGRKRYKAAFKENKLIVCDNPKETVIDRDSFIQMDNKITLEKFDDLVNYRRQTDKLSSQKLSDVLSAYRNYQDKNRLDENKIVYMDETEIRNLNR